MLQVAYVAITKWCKNPEKWQKTWQIGTHLRELSKSFPVNTNMAGFKWFSKKLCVFVLWTKVASALEGFALLLLRFLSSNSQKKQKKILTMLVFIGKLLLSSIRSVPICHGFGHFSAFCHHFVLTKLATSSERAKKRCLPLRAQWSCTPAEPPSGWGSEDWPSLPTEKKLQRDWECPSGDLETSRKHLV